MVPFERTWPYDIIMGDIYVSNCPFCDGENVLLPLRPEELKLIQEGKKRLLVFPCCHNQITVIDVDRDYLLANRALPRRK